MDKIRWVLTQWESNGDGGWNTDFVAVWDNKPTKDKINKVLNRTLSNDSMNMLLEKGDSDRDSYDDFCRLIEIKEGESDL